MNIIYLRVSKQDLKGQNGEEKTEQQVLEDQLPPILKKFNLKEEDCMILKEKGSAYDIDKIQNRTEFLEILNICFNASKTTISDLLLRNYEKQDINLYVFDSNRIMRNIEYGTLFTLLRYWFGINLFSVNQENLNVLESDTLGIKMSKYVMSSIDSYLAEGYSKNISDAVKKSYHKRQGITISREGKKWGRYFTNLDGKKVQISPSKVLELKERIKELNKSYCQKETLERIEKEFKLRISISFMNKVVKNG